jgi:hypothetical protein
MTRPPTLMMFLDIGILRSIPKRRYVISEWLSSSFHDMNLRSNSHVYIQGCTRVFYACDIALRTSPPGPILNYISKSALKQATSWVKKESESEPDNVIPKEFASKFSAPAVKEEAPKAAFGFGMRR